ncbi:S1C family serine protease [Uliginosibacterium paludis]|jgi:S1-C subfamily serine protease|uniref:Serine protease n=1 Tax=Uliginosibacterium paludis TaxID=1615952 RepID=A0ABV2CPM6_9RHOO
MRAALFGTLLLCLPGVVSAASSEQLFPKIAPSVWLLRTADQAGVPVGSASAVVTAPRELITNCHALARATTVVLVKGKQRFAARLEAADVERDLCLLAVDDSSFNAPAIDIADSDRLTVGQRVFTVGNPAALEITLADGLLSRLVEDKQNVLEAIQTSAPISPGSSGGGLFDDTGRLIGITSSTYWPGVAQNLNFAIPVNWLKEVRARSAKQLAEYYSSSSSKR